MKKQKFKEIINKTLDNLQYFARDINLTEEIIDCYKKGMIIRERAFTDASSQIGGMVTNCRYAILSNHMADFSSYENNTNWGLCVAQRDSHFEVLDVFKQGDKTQILLLHLPDNDWKLFYNFYVFFEGLNIVKNARELFAKLILEPPIKELSSSEWLDRCSFTLGLDDNNVPFDL